MVFDLVFEMGGFSKTENGVQSYKWGNNDNNHDHDTANVIVIVIVISYSAWYC